MNFLKLLDLNVVFYSILGTALLITYLSKEAEIKTLKDEKITTLEKLVKSEQELKKCEAKVNEQNQKIEDMKVEVTYIEPKSIEKVKNVFIKDSTCESELNAYKELFNE
jgi:cell division protein FtsB